MQYFNIQVASQLSGVASATIRAWEKRYKAVVPERGDNKHRLYSEKDIEKLALLSRLTEFGQSIGKIARLSLDELKDVYSTLSHKPYDRDQFARSRSTVDYQKILTNFFIALGTYKLDILSHEFEKAKSQLSPRDLCLHILVPLFHEIGNKVERRELTIAQEHTLSALASFHIGQMIGSHYQRSQSSKFLILITTPEGELHEIGILASALLCVHYGIRFIFMGPNLPAASLIEASNALKPQAILIGVARAENESSSIEKYVGEVRAGLTIESKILVGGNIKSYVKSELERKDVSYFPTLEAFDEWAQKL